MQATVATFGVGKLGNRRTLFVSRFGFFRRHPLTELKHFVRVVGLTGVRVRALFSHAILAVERSHYLAVSFLDCCDFLFRGEPAVHSVLIRRFAIMLAHILMRRHNMQQLLGSALRQYFRKPNRVNHDVEFCVGRHVGIRCQFFLRRFPDSRKRFARNRL